MPAERESQPIPLSGIKINLSERSIIFEAEDKPIAKVSLAAEGLIFEAAPSGSAEQLSSEQQEKEKTVTLSGRLKSLPREGKPDSRGNPTVYARFAAHEEGEAEARLYMATFHRNTVKIAVGLPRDAAIVVSGYPHKSDDPKRMDTFSVVNIVSYPGMPPKQKP